jgi:hypothetical protein
MAIPIQARDQQHRRGKLIKHAVGLLSQQIWCWGRDILRPEGNWLIDIGFDRKEPPDKRKECASVYSLELPRGRCLVLRGFGVFYGDQQHGGVFLPRFEFFPKYTTKATLESPPWSDVDLPALSSPTDSQQASCKALASDLIDWIRAYEMNIVDRLGIEYRRSMLPEWDNGKRLVIPAEEMTHAWQQLGVAIAEDFRVLIPQGHTKRRKSHA